VAPRVSVGLCQAFSVLVPFAADWPPVVVVEAVQRQVVAERERVSLTFVVVVVVEAMWPEVEWLEVEWLAVSVEVWVSVQVPAPVSFPRVSVSAFVRESACAASAGYICFDLDRASGQRWTQTTSRSTWPRHVVLEERHRHRQILELYIPRSGC
jgi:hypothetical protein